MRANAKRQKLHHAGIMEGKPEPKEHPFFGIRKLAALNAKKTPPPIFIRKRNSAINAARRRYVLGDDSAFEET